METGHKAIVVVGALAVLALASAGLSLSADGPPDRLAWEAKFQRAAEIPFPESNPYSEAKSKLGQLLFFDPILSGSQNAFLRHLP